MIPPYLFITDPIKAGELLDQYLSFHIELLVLHGSAVDGNYSGKSDIDFLIAVSNANLSIVKSKIIKLRGFDIMLMEVEELIKKSYYEPEIYYSAIKHGQLLIDKGKYKQRILDKGINLNLLRSKLQETSKILNVLDNVLEIVGPDDALWGCASSLWERYSVLYGINILLSKSKYSKIAMYHEPERLGLGKNIMATIHHFFKTYNNCYGQDNVYNLSYPPTKDLLLPVLSVIKKYKIEVTNNVEYYLTKTGSETTW
jgi:predicted nucleotidyltransferase